MKLNNFDFEILDSIVKKLTSFQSIQECVNLAKELRMIIRKLKIDD